MLRARQLARLVALVPVGATSTQAASTSEVYGQEQFISHENGLCVSTTSKNPSFNLLLHRGITPARRTDLKAIASPPSAQSVEKTAVVTSISTSDKLIQYLRGSVTTRATDQLLTSIESLFKGTWEDGADPAEKIPIRRLTQCTNKVFQLGHVAIFKPLSTVSVMSTSQGTRNHSVCCGSNNRNMSSQATALSVSNASVIAAIANAESKQKRVHPQRRGLYVDEEPSREMAAYVIDRQLTTLRCGVPATTTVALSLHRCQHCAQLQEEILKELGNASSNESIHKLQNMQRSNQFRKLSTENVDASAADGAHMTTLLQGTVQAFQPHTGPAEDYGDSMFQIEDVQRIAILDVRLFNTDRHGGNLLLTKKRRLVPIDHGLCLPDLRAVIAGEVEAEFVWSNWKHATQSISEKLLHTLINEVDIHRDAEVLRRLGVRESCVATSLLSTVFLQWALNPRSHTRPEGGGDDLVWSLKDVACFQQNLSFESDSKSGFALLLEKLLKDLQIMEPTLAKAWLHASTEEPDVHMTMQLVCAFQKFIRIPGNALRPEVPQMQSPQHVRF